MGKFFNLKVMNASKMPTNMESQRKQFNEEQKNETIRSQTTEEAGIADSKGIGNEGKPDDVVSVRRRRQKRTRRTYKGNSGKAGRN